jgi:hypothetical protein
MLCVGGVVERTQVCSERPHDLVVKSGYGKGCMPYLPLSSGISKRVVSTVTMSP